MYVSVCVDIYVDKIFVLLRLFKNVTVLVSDPPKSTLLLEDSTCTWRHFADSKQHSLFVYTIYINIYLHVRVCLSLCVHM